MTLLKPLLIAAMLASPALADEELVAEAITDYMDFATYESGIILPAQLEKDVFEAATIIDTRDVEQFDTAHIPGALHIEWREIPARLDELPENGLVVLYCNTGSLSAQATFAARLMGRENVVVLQTGLTGWQQTAAYKP